MKSKQLLSIVFSLIMFTGVTASSAAFAETDEYYEQLEDQLEDFCDMTADEQSNFFSENPDLAKYDERLADICEIDDFDLQIDAIYEIIDEIIPETRDDVADDFDEMDDVIEDFEDCVEAGYPVMESYPEQCRTDDGTVFVNEEQVNDYDDDYDDDKYAKGDKFYVCHNGKNTLSIAESAVRAHLAHGDSMRKCPDAVRDSDRDYDDKMHTDKDMRHSLEKYCEMSDNDRAAYIAEHDKTADKAAKMDRYCTLDEDGRTDFIADHLDEYKAYMKDKMKDKKHMDYDRLCSMAASDRASEITDVAKLDKISKWCEMTPEEREDYKRDHKGDMKDKMMDKKHDFDGMSDMAKDRMSDVAKDKQHDKKMKFSDESKRLKAMIMTKHDISDERMDEIKMKFKEKHGDKSDEKRAEIKMKFKDHMLKMKFEMSDERKSDIHDRITEMKAFKADLRDRASELSDEEKQELRAEFIEKAKDMQLAWISPRTQMTAGLDAADVECREGFSLVMKASNGVAMCLKANTALKMIDRGIAVPAN